MAEYIKRKHVPNGTMFIAGKPVAGCYVYARHVGRRTMEIAVRDIPKPDLEKVVVAHG